MILTDMIAYAAFVLSSFNFIWFIVTHSKRIDVSITAYREHKTSDYYWSCIEFMIENNSQLPISISRIEIDDYKSKCNINKEILKETTNQSGNVVKSVEYVYSIQLPLNIPGLDSRLERFIFKPSVQIEKEKKFNITIFTNRGTIKKRIMIPKDIESTF